jgi:arylsulfatase A-like enzyme/tetratricopeptide (TPR) repeat protein
MQQSLAVATVVACLSAACARSEPVKTNPNAGLGAGALRGANLLLITIDTLRADHVGAYGSQTPTPTLDRLAASGIRFSQARSHVPLTLPAHTSILTGLVPATHGVHNNGASTLNPKVPTLAERLLDAGYRTAAFVGAFVLDARFGLARGFEVYDDRIGSESNAVTFEFAERTADRVVEPAGDWILTRGSTGLPTEGGGSARSEPVEGRARPWFAWIHLYDPHAPYRAPEPRAADPYANEVAFVDAQIGRLLDRLRAAGTLDRTLIVVLADHGESLGDHGEATHGLFAYDATLRIPLIMAGPEIAAAVVDRAVGQADVMPTVLDLVGLEAGAPLDGRSMLPAIRGAAPAASAPIYIEALDAYLARNWAPLVGIVDSGWKYIDLPDPELYDLEHDPGEQRNVAAREPQRVGALKKTLSKWDALSLNSGAAAGKLDAKASARLRSLGYAATARPTPKRAFTPDDDPKRLLDLDRRYQRALALTGEGNVGEAATLLRSVIGERRDFAVAYTGLASALIGAGRAREAVAVLEEAKAHGMETPETQVRLASAYLAADDPARASAVLEPLVARGDGGLESVNTLAVALSQLGRLDRARGLYQAVVRQSPASATTWNNLGLLEMAARRPEEAAKAFERAVQADAKLGLAWQGLGAARAASNPRVAIDAWIQAEKLLPRDYDLLFNLAVLLHEEGRTAQARPYMERFVREAPPGRYARDIAAFRTWLAQ